jgi:uncharacterized protein (DUF4415 family)
MKKEYDFQKANRGAVVRSKAKTCITIFLDDEILDAFRKRVDEAGTGYQTMINEALREYLGKTSGTIDEETLRRVIREELRSAW